MRVVFVRHGQTAWNAEHRFLGRTDLPLDAVGEQQVSALAPLRGRFTDVWCSPLVRARATAAVFADAPRVEPAFAELDHGDMEGLPVDEARRRFSAFFEAWAVDPATVPIPGGDRLDAARDAAWAQLASAVAASAGPLVVVSHQMVLASLLCTIDGAPLAAWRQYRLPNAGGAVVDLAVADGQLRGAVVHRRLEAGALVAAALS